MTKIKKHQISSAGASDGDVMTADGAGNVDWEAPPAGGVVDAADVTYTPAVATDWDGDADPGNADDALDQLAERVDDLEVGAGHAAVTLDADAAVLLDLSGQEIQLDTQSANTVLAGPATGAANEPTFRALVAADVGSGSPTGSKYLKDDMSWDTPAGGAVDAADVTYTPAVLTDWDGDADPGNADDALDQLAERVDDLEGTSHAALTLDADAAAILDLSTQEIGLDTQSANTVLAGPASGAANEPTFRSLVAADIPTYAQILVVAQSGAPYSTIQSAIDAISDATSTKRYLVWIMPGTYTEQITMKSWVDLRGAGKHATRLTFTGNNNGTIILADWVQIEDILIETSDTSTEWAILGTNCSNWHIRNVDILSASTSKRSQGIKSTGTSWHTGFIEHCVMNIYSQTGYGIYMESDGADLADVTINDVFLDTYEATSGGGLYLKNIIDIQVRDGMFRTSANGFDLKVLSGSSVDVWSCLFEAGDSSIEVDSGGTLRIWSSYATSWTNSGSIYGELEDLDNYLNERFGAAGQIRFFGTAGGGGEGITYLDSGSAARFGLYFPGSDIVALCNRASNGVVQLRANTSTAGAGGEVTEAEIQDDKMLIYKSLIVNENGDDADSRIEGDSDANLLYTDAGNDRVGIGTAAPGNKLDVNGGITANGVSYIGDTANANNTAGLTLNQGAADDEIFSMKSSDVVHGITDNAETDTYGMMMKTGAADGGLKIVGLNEVTIGLNLHGYAVTDDTARSTAAIGYVNINSAKKSGTGLAALGTNGNLLTIRNNGATKFLVDAEGDIHMDATSNINAWDDYNDVALLAGLRGSLLPDGAVMKEQLAEWIEYARPVLERTGVVTYNKDGNHFLSTKGFNALLIDTIRQLYGKVQKLEGKLAELR